MAKTVVTIEDTKSAAGGEGKGMKMEVEGELVTLQNDEKGGFKCTVNGKEFHFSDAEIATMLHDQL